jgi:nucleoside-diphosphate kinase
MGVLYYFCGSTHKQLILMAGKITLTMIKPEAVRDGNAGAILDMIIKGGFKIIGMKYLKLTREQAMKFYEVHKERPFYSELTEFMSSGPIVAAILEKENAIQAYREFIGATNPAEAADGTVRAKFGTNIQENAVHGSDSDENAIIESGFFFSKLERVY